MDFTYRSGARPLDGYTIKRGLGRGGFGEAYYAISDGGKEVALKVVLRHMEVELRGVSQCLNLKHSNLVAVHDVRRGESGEVWIVMEYMAGQSLAQRLERAGLLPIAEVFHWLDGIVAAIDYLHDRGIVHRDLKPGNVFSEEAIVKVGDYGLSKFISHSRRSGHTQSVGTVHYMAPEISTGNYGRGVDIYSIAVMAFEMLSGDVPFDGETAGEILMKHLTAEPELHKVDPRFRQVFRKALAKDPQDRFATASEFLTALREAAGELASGVQPPPEVAPRRISPAHAVTMSLPPEPGTAKARRREVSELLGGLFAAGLLSIVLPILTITADLTLNGSRPDAAGYVSLVVLTGLSSWGLLILGRFWEIRSTESSNRHLDMLLFGLVVGIAALGINWWLQRGVDVPAGSVAVLLEPENFQDLAPTLLVYLSLFGVAFALPDWQTLIRKQRPTRISFWNIIWPACIAVVLTNMLGGPDATWIGGIFALTGLIVQWVAPYQSSARPRKLRRPRRVGRMA